jgi:hypothetical protein
VLGVAMRAAGITDEHCDPPADRGDGFLALVHPSDDVPKTLLLNPLIPTLAALLADRNASLPDAERHSRELRLRVVIHAGEVYYDRNGYFGEELDAAFRLLDAPQLKDRLRQVDAPLALVVSEDIYWSVVRHEFEGTPGHTFEQMVRVNVAGRRRRGWVHTPVPRLRSSDPKLPRYTPDLIPGVDLAVVYQALERRLAETEEPHNVEAGLARLKNWMSAGQSTPEAGPQSGILDGNRHIVAC